MSRVVKVRRVITVEYVVPAEAYTIDDRQMTEAEIEFEEKQDVDADVILENITSEIVSVEFVSEAIS